MARATVRIQADGQCIPLKSGGKYVIRVNRKQPAPASVGTWAEAIEKAIAECPSGGPYAKPQSPPLAPSDLTWNEQNPQVLSKSRGTDPNGTVMWLVVRAMVHLGLEKSLRRVQIADMLRQAPIFPEGASKATGGGIAGAFAFLGWSGPLFYDPEQAQYGDLGVIYYENSRGRLHEGHTFIVTGKTKNRSGMAALDTFGCQQGGKPGNGPGTDYWTMSWSRTIAGEKMRRIFILCRPSLPIMGSSHKSVAPSSARAKGSAGTIGASSKVQKGTGTGKAKAAAGSPGTAAAPSKNPGAAGTGKADASQKRIFLSQVPLIRQRGATECYPTAKRMIDTSGLARAPSYCKGPGTNAGCIFVSVDGDPSQKNHGLGNQDSSGRLMKWNHAKMQQARSYIDKQLEAQRPVLVGVSFKKKELVYVKARDAYFPYNQDGVTDHYVAIVGRTISGTRTTYDFNDPAGGKAYQFSVVPSGSSFKLVATKSGVGHCELSQVIFNES